MLALLEVWTTVFFRRLNLDLEIWDRVMSFFVEQIMCQTVVHIGGSKTQGHL